ncbi:MAG: hypothetical protein ABFC57_06215 [Veillonellales bacterium]
MDITIKETGEVKDLTIIDCKTGCEWTADLITASDFWNDETEQYEMSHDDFDWWTEYISDTEKTEKEAEKLADELEEKGIEFHNQSALEFVKSKIAKNTDNDYSDHRWQAQQTMNEIRDEYLK